MIHYCPQCAAPLPSEQALREHLQAAHTHRLVTRPPPGPSKGKQERFG